MLMQLLKNIRKSRDWTPYRMAKELKITQTSYNHYEEAPPSNREMVLLRLFEISGLTLQEFWDLFTKEVRQADKARLKKLIE